MHLLLLRPLTPLVLACGLAVLAACQVTPIAPLAPRSLLIQGTGTEVRMVPQSAKLSRSGILDFQTQSLVDDRQVTGHLGFELDATPADPTLRAFGQAVPGRTVKLKSMGAVPFERVALDTIPTDSGSSTSVAGLKVNDVLLFKVSDAHAGEEFGKLVIRKATTLVVTFDYALQTDGKNAQQVCPTPTPDPDASASPTDLIGAILNGISASPKPSPTPQNIVAAGEQ